MISNSCHRVNEIFVLLGHYAALIGRHLLIFRDDLKPVTDYRSTPCNIPENEDLTADNSYCTPRSMQYKRQMSDRKLLMFVHLLKQITEIQ